MYVRSVTQYTTIHKIILCYVCDGLYYVLQQSCSLKILNQPLSLSNVVTSLRGYPFQYVHVRTKAITNFCMQIFHFAGDAKQKSSK